MNVSLPAFFDVNLTLYVPTGEKSSRDGDFSFYPKYIGISMFGEDVSFTTYVSLPSGKAEISPNGELPLEMMVKVSQAILVNNLEKTNIGTVTFTIEIVE